MRCSRGRAVFRFVCVEKIAAHVAAWNFQLAHQSDHNVRKILADAPARSQRMIDGRIHFGGVRRVIEFVVERLVHFHQQVEWHAAPSEF